MNYILDLNRMMDISGYLQNILKGLVHLFSAILAMVFAFVGRKVRDCKQGIEGFNTGNPYISVQFLTMSIIAILAAVIYGYGAANLSFCYNKALGRTDTEALLWAVLAYFFSALYYPYYSIVLNPTCPTIKSGGRR